MKRDSSSGLQGRILGGLLIVLVVFGAVRLFPVLFRLVELAAVSALRFWWVTLIIILAIGFAIRLRKKPSAQGSADLHVIRPTKTSSSSENDEDSHGPIH